jgi:hypothetical protein
VPFLGLETVTTGSLAIGVIMSRHYLLIITALRAGEGSYLPRAEGRHDCCLVPLEDVVALFAPLTEGDDRAPLVDYQASLNLYRHVSRPTEVFPLDHRDTEAIVPELRLIPAARESGGYANCRQCIDAGEMWQITALLT